MTLENAARGWVLQKARMLGLVIFTIFAMAGCGFLIYFLIALWRDGHKLTKGQRVEIRILPIHRKPYGKLLRMYSVDELRERKSL